MSGDELSGDRQPVYECFTHGFRTTHKAELQLHTSEPGKHDLGVHREGAEDQPIPMLSTGQPSTLGHWHAMCLAMFGEESSATKFIKAKLDAQGADMAVLSDEGQLLYALMVMNFNDDTPPTEGAPS